MLSNDDGSFTLPVRETKRVSSLPSQHPRASEQTFRREACGLSRARVGRPDGQVHFLMYVDLEKERVAIR